MAANTSWVFLVEESLRLQRAPVGDLHVLALFSRFLNSVRDRQDEDPGRERAATVDSVLLGQPFADFDDGDELPLWDLLHHIRDFARVDENDIVTFLHTHFV